MKLHTFLILPTLFFGLNGVLALLVPVQWAALQLLTVDATGELLARTAGAAFIGNAVICWSARGAEKSPALRAILLGYMVYFTLQLVADVFAVLTLGAFGLIEGVVVLALLLAGFVYYYFNANRVYSPA